MRKCHREKNHYLGMKEVEIEQIALILAYNYLCLVFLENWSNFANLSLFGKMPQRKESLFRNERSGEIWVLRIFSKGTGILQEPMDLLLSI